MPSILPPNPNPNKFPIAADMKRMAIINDYECDFYQLKNIKFCYVFGDILVGGYAVHVKFT